MVMVSCGKDKELTARVDALEEKVESLTEENSRLKASLSEAEGNITALGGRADSIEEGLLFDAPSYPVKYELTDKSYEEFKSDLIEIVNTVAKLTDISDEDLSALLEMINLYDTKALVEEVLGTDSTYVEFISDYELVEDDDTETYTIENGKLYVYGDEVASIDEDKLTITEEAEGMSISINFYRTTPKSSGKVSLKEKLEEIEEKATASYAYCYY